MLSSFDFVYLTDGYLNKLYNATIAVKTIASREYDPVTRKNSVTYNETSGVNAYVSTWRFDQIANSNNKLSVESRKVIMKDTVNVTPSSIIAIDGVDHKIDLIVRRPGYIVLGVSRK